MRSSKLEFIYNFTVTLKSEADRPHANHGEVLAFGVSPTINDIKQFDENLSTAVLNGNYVFMYRTKEGKGVIVLKEFNGNTKFDLREMFEIDHNDISHNYCEHNFINQTTHLNITVDFYTGTMWFDVNGRKCVLTRISKSIYPEQKATTLTTGISSPVAPISVTFHEIAISKKVTILTANDTAFTDSVQNVISTMSNFDPDYYKNTSLSNMLLISVF
jgi:hypothetical protein